MVHKADQNEATHAQNSDDLTADTTASLTVDGCVCPQCFRHLRAPVVTESPPDRYGRHIRSYAGMCFNCRRGCRVIQFEQDGKWLIQYTIARDKSPDARNRTELMIANYPLPRRR